MLTKVVPGWVPGPEGMDMMMDGMPEVPSPVLCGAAGELADVLGFGPYLLRTSVSKTGMKIVLRKAVNVK